MHSLETRYLDRDQSGMDAKTAQNIRQTLDMALEAGAEAADIVLAEGQSQSLKAQNDKISENKISASRIIGLRVQVNGRIGLSYSESMLEQDRRSMVEMAVSNSAFTKEDPSQSISLAACEPMFPDCSAQYLREDISLAQKEELTRCLESEPLARDVRVRVVPYNGFGESYSSHYVANSCGVFCYERSHDYSCYTYVLMEENGAKADYGESSMGRSFAELDLEFCVGNALAEAAMLLHAKPLASGSYDVIFTPDALAALFSCFGMMFSGFAAKTKTNPMRDKLGQRIASEQLHIYDVPRYSDSLHTQYFDSEGAVPQDLCLIKKGVLQNFYHNSETARYFDVASNARAARSPQGSLSTAGNCSLIASDNSAGDVRSGQFFEVLELHGLHSGCDAISGDFSLPCNGKLFRNGELVQGVRDVTLAGNFYRMLEQLSAVGSELKSTAGRTFFTPDLRFPELTIAG